jgi:hypothetical protein
MATAAVQLDEESLILEIIAGIPLPEGVSFKKLKLGEGSEGEPAWFAYFSVSRSVATTKRFISNLGQIRTELRRRLYPFPFDRWVYVNFEDAR